MTNQKVFKIAFNAIFLFQIIIFISCSKNKKQLKNMIKSKDIDISKNAKKVNYKHPEINFFHNKYKTPNNYIKEIFKIGFENIKYVDLVIFNKENLENRTSIEIMLDMINKMLSNHKIEYILEELRHFFFILFQI